MKGTLWTVGLMKKGGSDQTKILTWIATTTRWRSWSRNDELVGRLVSRPGSTAECDISSVE